MWHILILVSLAVGYLGASSWAWSAPPGLERVQYGEDALAFSSGFIRDALPLEGVVSAVTGDHQTTGNRRLLGKGDRIYLSLKDQDSVKPGDILTLYRHVHEVLHPSDRAWIGNLFKIVGIVEMVETMERPATVEVLRAYDSIFPGDRAMRFVPPPHPAPRLPGAMFDGVGMIIDVPPAHTLVAQGQVVYLDRGREDGLRAGDRLEVFRESERMPKLVIGELKVLTAEPHTAAAVITKSRYPYLRGDRFSTKEAAPEVVKAPQADEPGEEPGAQQIAGVVPPGSSADGPVQDVTLVLEGLLDQLAFESGEVTIRPQGKETLKLVSEILKEVTDTRIQILGHTDNVPIGPALSSTYPSNWELSQARAREVIRYLVEETGLAAGRLSGVGYADTQPVASNASEEGRTKNRRVEIVVLSPDSPRATPGGPAGEPLAQPSSDTTTGSPPVRTPPEPEPTAVIP